MLPEVQRTCLSAAFESLPSSWHHGVADALTLWQARHGVCGLWLPGKDIRAGAVAALPPVHHAPGGIHLYIVQALT